MNSGTPSRCIKTMTERNLSFKISTSKSSVLDMGVNIDVIILLVYL